MLVLHELEYCQQHNKNFSKKREGLDDGQRSSSDVGCCGTAAGDTCRMGIKLNEELPAVAPQLASMRSFLLAWMGFDKNIQRCCPAGCGQGFVFVIVSVSMISFGQL